MVRGWDLEKFGTLVLTSDSSTDLLNVAIMKVSGSNIYQDVVIVGPADLAPGLSQRDVGTVLEVFDGGNYEVEFINDDGSTRVLQAFPAVYLQHFVSDPISS